MANAFSNPTVVVREALRHLKNNCVMGRLVHRGYQDVYAKRYEGWNQGASVTVNGPVYFRVKTARAIDTVDLKQRNITFTVNQWRQVSWTLNTEEMTMDLDKWSEDYIRPAMQAIANRIDSDLLGLYADVPNQVGTPGSTPSTFYVFAQAQARLSEEGCPEDNRALVIEAQAQAKLADSFKGLFLAPVVGKAIRKGKITESFAGFQTFMSQNVNTHTVGTWAAVGDIQKDAASSEGDTTLALKSTGAAQTANVGDIFTIAAVNSVNPISGTATGSLRQFVVDTAASMDGSGEIAALSITPGSTDSVHKIYSSAADEEWVAYQTVNTLPANNAAVTVSGTSGLVHPVSLGFHKDAFSLCMVPIVIPKSAHWSAQMTHDGYTISVIRYFDGDTISETVRFDALYGIKTINPFLAVRIAG